MMNTLQPGTVILLMLEAENGIKRRPAVVIFDPGDEQVVVAPITSQPVQTAFDVELIAWQEAGLVLPGTVRTHRPTALDRSLIERELGSLARSDWARVRAMIHRIWSSI
jgi:mRNA interferase MazF